MKINCWEYRRCGREPYGKNVMTLGVCPAAKESKLHGVHGGINAGRSCWVVPGTLCNGEIQGPFAQKYDTCKDCDFYQMVHEENLEDFQLSTLLLKKLRNVECSI